MEDVTVEARSVVCQRRACAESLDKVALNGQLVQKVPETSPSWQMQVLTSLLIRSFKPVFEGTFSTSMKSFQLAEDYHGSLALWMLVCGLVIFASSCDVKHL